MRRGHIVETPIAALLVVLFVLVPLEAGADVAPRGPAQAWLYSCGGPGYPLSLFEEPAGAERERNPGSQALRALIRHPNGIETLPKKGWRRAYSEPGLLVFVARRPGAPSGLFEVAFERRNGGAWDYGGSSHYCSLGTWLENQAVVDWTLNPDFPRPRPGDTEVHALVSGSYCRSGAPPDLTDPLISSGPERLVIAPIENPPEPGFYTCQGTPPVEYTFELHEPIGNRVLMDAADYPFEKRADLRP